jgi:hypothetical protein
MKKVVEYKTVSTRETDDLDKRVNELLKEGYSLYGDPYIRPAEHEVPIHHCQVMIKESDG